ncbi:MAG: aspartate/glutamate racemase family protein, partial [Pseudomonadota bacterium]
GMITAELDPAPAHALGLIVLSTDETLENEARLLLSDRSVRLHHSRIFSKDDVTPGALAEMRARIGQSAALLPETVRAVGYACTSASVVIGPEAVATEVRAGRPGVSVTNPISAVAAALDALEARRIGLVTPYLAEVVAPMRAHLARNGIEVAAEVSFGEADDRRVARIPETKTEAAARQVADGAEAIFLSCTNLQTLKTIRKLERDLDIPVISSNLALIWHLLQLVGVPTRGWGEGRLFEQEASIAQNA